MIERERARELNIPHLERQRILAPLTTYQIGGPADFFVSAPTSEVLVAAVREARRARVPYFILGCGANILVTDKGFRGLVIHNEAAASEFLEGNRLRADSGAIVAGLITAARDRELSGLEHYVGIPSTVGGALWQNLHFLSPAPSRERTVFIAEILERARVLNEENDVKDVGPDYFQFSYDYSTLHDRRDIVLDATFQLTPKPKEEIQRVMDENMAWRKAKQPQLEEYPSCGSVFKKIEGVGAGRLIEQSGLKGYRIGGVMVSPKHANYFVNVDHATAADVLALIEHVQRVVKEKTGHQLEPEISIIGER